MAISRLVFTLFAKKWISFHDFFQKDDKFLCSKKSIRFQGCQKSRLVFTLSLCQNFDKFSQFYRNSRLVFNVCVQKVNQYSKVQQNGRLVFKTDNSDKCRLVFSKILTSRKVFSFFFKIFKEFVKKKTISFHDWSKLSIRFWRHCENFDKFAQLLRNSRLVLICWFVPKN